jgi:hypothetical protein
MGNRRVALVQLVTSDSVLKVKKGFGKSKKNRSKKQEPRAKTNTPHGGIAHSHTNTHSNRLDSYFLIHNFSFIY